MSKNIFGGGAKTNKNGLKFEQDTVIEKALSEANFDVDTNANTIIKDLKEIGKYSRKNGLYKDILGLEKDEWCKAISKQLLPDEVLYVFEKKTIYIIEKKFQNGAGSVDEKLQTCDFKLKQYKKLIAFANKKNNTNNKVEYLYILGGKYFLDPKIKEKLKDVFQYITDQNCKYYFENIPLSELF